MGLIDSLALASRAAASAGAPPLDPDAGTARHDLIVELSKPEYQTGKANWAKVITQAIEDWVRSLQLQSGPAGLSPVGILIIIVVGVVILGLAFLIFGLPRLNRRSSAAGSLFGDDDSRAADALRAAAERAAAAGDFSTAVAEGFRAIARGLSERGVVTTFPGTTASGFAHRAGEQFASLAPDLGRAADAFDSVRYLGLTGDSEQWALVRGLDRALQNAKPRADLVTA